MDQRDSVMRLLGAGIPLTLLLDLAEPPDARELLRREVPSPRRSATDGPSAGSSVRTDLDETPSLAP